MKITSLLNKETQQLNMQKLKKVQRELTNTYRNEQLEYIQGQKFGGDR